MCIDPRRSVYESTAGARGKGYPSAARDCVALPACHPAGTSGAAGFRENAAVPENPATAARSCRPIASSGAARFCEPQHVHRRTAAEPALRVRADDTGRRGVIARSCGWGEGAAECRPLQRSLVRRAALRAGAAVAPSAPRSPAGVGAALRVRAVDAGRGGSDGTTFGGGRRMTLDAALPFRWFASARPRNRTARAADELEEGG